MDCLLNLRIYPKAGARARDNSMDCPLKESMLCPGQSMDDPNSPFELKTFIQCMRYHSIVQGVECEAALHGEDS